MKCNIELQFFVVNMDREIRNLLPNGEVAIDTYTDHVGRTPFDHEIPFTEEAIEAIFDKGEDYLLDYAVGYANK